MLAGGLEPQAGPLPPPAFALPAASKRSLLLFATPAPLPLFSPFFSRPASSPEYSTWAGMIVTHYGRLGVGEEGDPSDIAYAHMSQSRTMRRLRGYSSTGPSRSQSPKYGSGAAGAGAVQCSGGARGLGGVAQGPEPGALHVCRHCSHWPGCAVLFGRAVYYAGYSSGLHRTAHLRDGVLPAPAPHVPLSWAICLHFIFFMSLAMRCRQLLPMRCRQLPPLF